MKTGKQNESNRALAAYQIANQQFGLGHYPQAIVSYHAAIRLQPDAAQAYHGRGTAYAALRDFDLALRDASQAIVLDPNYALAYYLHGAVSYAIGNLEMAKTNLALAADLFRKADQQTDYEKVIGLLKNIENN
jgi:tetratricopeptide (TPR) repeat protein